MIFCQHCGRPFRAPSYPIRCACGAVMREAPLTPFACIHRGPPTGDHLACSTCGGGGQLPIYLCDLHGECTIRRPVRVAGASYVEMPDCLGCGDQQAE